MLQQIPKLQAAASRLLVVCVVDARFGNPEEGVALGKARIAYELGLASVTASLLQLEARRCRVGKDVSTDRLERGPVRHPTVNHSLHLVRDENCDLKLLGNACQLAQEAAEVNSER